MTVKIPFVLDTDKILLFGDSLTQWAFDMEHRGWATALAHAYVRKADVINRGYSGYNTEWAKHLLPSTLTSIPDHSNLLFITIFLGANDAALPGSKQYIPIPQYQANLKEMIQICRDFISKRSYKDTKILLLTPPPLNEEVWGKHCLEKGRALDRKVEVTLKYRDACIVVAKETGTNYLDTWPALLANITGVKENGGDNGVVDVNSAAWKYDAEVAKSLLHDGLHMGPGGNKRLFEGILKYMQWNSEWKALHPEQMTAKLPWWDQIDEKDVVESLFGFQPERRQ
jgi:isoamyl acetate esterase